MIDFIVYTFRTHCCFLFWSLLILSPLFPAPMVLDFVSFSSTISLHFSFNNSWTSFNFLFFVPFYFLCKIFYFFSDPSPHSTQKHLPFYKPIKIESYQTMAVLPRGLLEILILSLQKPSFWKWWCLVSFFVFFHRWMCSSFITYGVGYFVMIILKIRK